MKNVQNAKCNGDFAPLRNQNCCVMKFRPIYINNYNSQRGIAAIVLAMFINDFFIILFQFLLFNFLPFLFISCTSPKSVVFSAHIYLRNAACILLSYWIPVEKTDNNFGCEVSYTKAVKVRIFQHFFEVIHQTRQKIETQE